MEQYISKSALVAEIKRLHKAHSGKYGCDEVGLNLEYLEDFLDTLEMKEVDYDKEVTEYLNNLENANIGYRLSLRRCAKHFFELGLKASNKPSNVWNEVSTSNYPQPDKKKIYFVLTKGRVIAARVVGHHHDDDLLQWKCTEFPNHLYDMCEGDKYFEVKE